MENNDEYINNYSKYQLKEVDPRNPFGPNSYYLTKLYKKYYKIKKIITYVQLSEEDDNIIQMSNYIYYFGCIGIGLALFSSSFILNKYVISSSFIYGKYLHRIPNFNNIIYALSFAGGFTIGYNYLFEYTITKYWYPIHDKYIKEAIKNGFEDYEISIDKKK